ncbi:hypothetical protein [Alicyclobacillus shizuokensis]|uniref:hypothetical protein n=1 Tax=Alicyclobacillus shizuokensis TaxID=392014 RepID=UPI00082D5CF5|nr:hypothetical protein [Alicyclobacillus shizuokensis]
MDALISPSIPSGFPLPQEHTIRHIVVTTEQARQRHADRQRVQMWIDAATQEQNDLQELIDAYTERLPNVDPIRAQVYQEVIEDLVFMIRRVQARQKGLSEALCAIGEYGGSESFGR